MADYFETSIPIEISLPQTEIEGNTVLSVLSKAEQCKPVQIYPLEVLGVELEAIVYCLERSKNSKSKNVQQLIASLYSYFDYEG